MSLESTPDPVFLSETVKCALIGLMRDLRGIAMATNRFWVNSCVPFCLTKLTDILLAYVSLNILFAFFFSRRTFGFLFDWLYPAHMPLLLKIIMNCADSPQVIAFSFGMSLFRDEMLPDISFSVTFCGRLGVVTFLL